MTKELLKQALDALTWASDLTQVAQDYMPMHETIAAIRAHLAQPQAEPVAWMWRDQDGLSTIQSVKPNHDATPLYTNPVPAVPTPLPENTIRANAEAVELWNALQDLLFECDGVTYVKAPSRETYNRTFALLQKKNHLAPQPVALTPLTDEQIKSIRRDLWPVQMDSYELGSFQEFARAIEAAHGIGATP